MRLPPPRIARLALVWTLLSPGLFYYSAAVTASETDKLVLGTATKGGGFQLFGQHLLEVINANDASLRLEELPTKGSAQNLPFLEEGKIDVGLVEGNAA